MTQIILQISIASQQGIVHGVASIPVDIPELLGPPRGLEHFSPVELARELARRVEAHGDDL